MCKKLLKFVEEGVASMKAEGAANFMINDYIQEMGTGDAKVCEGCEKYQKCFPEVEEEEVEI